MPTRELVALALGPLVLVTILFAPAWVFLLFAGLSVVAAGFELLTMARSSGVACGRWLPLLALALILVLSWRFGWSGFAAASAATLLVLPAAQLAHPDRPRGGLNGAAVACFTALFLGFGGACFGWLRLLPQPEVAGRLTALFLLCIWIGDSGAYYVGRTWGRHRMSPRISPKKSWEGLAGGTVATFAAALGLGSLVGGGLDPVDLLALATILAVAAPVGDLIESHIKRDTGVKDSSGLLLGHGGFLDRTDSVLYGAPPFLAYLAFAGLLG